MHHMSLGGFGRGRPIADLSYEYSSSNSDESRSPWPKDQSDQPGQGQSDQRYRGFGRGDSTSASYQQISSGDAWGDHQREMSRQGTNLTLVSSSETGYRCCTCFKCGKEGHIQRKCPQVTAATTHTDTDTIWSMGAGIQDYSESMVLDQQPSHDVQKSRKPIVCYNCKKEGHPSRECPEKWNLKNEIPSARKAVVRGILLFAGKTVTLQHLIEYGPTSLFSISEEGIQEVINLLIQDEILAEVGVYEIPWPLSTSKTTKPMPVYLKLVSAVTDSFLAKYDLTKEVVIAAICQKPTIATLHLHRICDSLVTEPVDGGGEDI